jgi:hypothetical protein
MVRRTARFNNSGYFERLASYHEKSLLSRIVDSKVFDITVCVLVFLNAVFVGIQTDQLIRVSRIGFEIDTGDPAHFETISMVFCIIFATELCLKLIGDGREFFVVETFYGPRVQWWNIFDAVLISAQVVVEVIALALETKIGFLHMQFNLLRIIRLFGLIRVIRSVKLLKMVSELRSLVISIAESVKYLLWTAVLLALIIYTLSIWLTLLVAHYPAPGLEEFYGSTGRPALTLFAAITGGLDWREAVLPLMEHVSWVMGPVYVAYILFAVFSMTNVITGVFVQMGLRSAQHDLDYFMINNVREVFQGLEKMSWQDFEKRLDSSHMRDYFKAIDVCQDEAYGVFRLIDLSGSGHIDPEEFLSGCLRLRGPAKALDLALLMHEVGQIAASLSTLNAGTVQPNAGRVMEQPSMAASAYGLIDNSMTASVFAPPNPDAPCHDPPPLGASHPKVAKLLSVQTCY